MQLNVTTDYAIRTVLYLAVKDELATANEIATAMGIPPSYVLKITRKLVAAGIIKRIVGPKSKRRSVFTKSSMGWRPLQSLTAVWRPISIAAALLLKIVLCEPFTVSYRG